VTRYRVTVRYGRRYQRYHTLDVEAGDVAGALRLGADGIPEVVLAEADLVEVRAFVEAEERRYLEDG